MLGRVSSLDWLISIGLLPLSFALTGPVSAAIGAQGTLVAAGVVGAVVTLAALCLPGMRAVEGRGPPGASRGATEPARSRRSGGRLGAAPGGQPHPPGGSDPGTRRPGRCRRRSDRHGLHRRSPLPQPCRRLRG